MVAQPHVFHTRDRKILPEISEETWQKNFKKNNEGKFFIKMDIILPVLEHC